MSMRRLYRKTGTAHAALAEPQAGPRDVRDREAAVKIGQYAFDEFVDKVREFHGSAAPGVIAGGVMVDIAREHLPQGKLYDVVCESAKCLPDAVQLLTPCTLGNGWLKVCETSRYALAFFDKYTGEGVRVFLDASALGPWPALRAWFLKEKAKAEQDQAEIVEEIKKAGRSIYGIEHVRVKRDFLASRTRRHRPVSLCPSCGEAYMADLGQRCPACMGTGPYETG